VQQDDQLDGPADTEVDKQEQHGRRSWRWIPDGASQRLGNWLVIQVAELLVPFTSISTKRIFVVTKTLRRKSEVNGVEDIPALTGPDQAESG
jgi:hypothetical protein